MTKSHMTEKELCDFIENPQNKESETLEYKLKPNFNEIDQIIKEIKEKACFNILKTIYAFANAKGGDLYIGIKEIKESGTQNSKQKQGKRRIEGLDDSDKNIVEKKILNQVSPIIKTKKEKINLENGRIVIKIKVYPLKLYEKPLFADGILYVRASDTTRAIKTYEDYLSLYENKQLYMFYEKGIKSNLKKLTGKRSHFEVQQFIEGLKMHVRFFINNNKITGCEKALEDVESLLDQMQQEAARLMNVKARLKPAALPTDQIKQEPVNSKDDLQYSHSDLDSLIDKFIKIYKNIVSKG